LSITFLENIFKNARKHLKIKELSFLE